MRLPFVYLLLSVPLIILSSAVIVLAAALAPDDSYQFAAQGTDRTGPVGIYLIDLERNLAQRVGDGMRPAWGNRADQLAFDTSHITQAHIYQMTLPGRQQRDLSSKADTGWASRPAWSSDGSALVWRVIATDLNPQQQVYRMDMQTGSIERWFTFLGDIAQITLAPDGSGALLTARTPDVPVPRYFFYLDGWEEPRLLDNMVWGTWSPDAAQMVVGVLGPDGYDVDLYIADVDANTETGLDLAAAAPLTAVPARETYPAWSPDGRYIAYLTGIGNKDGFHIYEIATQSTLSIPLTRSDILSNPRWSPDSKIILFDVYQRSANRNTHLWLHVDEGVFHPLETDEAFSHVSWRPPG